MKGLSMFARLVKVDEAKRQVTGILADETPDIANEVFDYATSKPHFQKWSGEVAKASDGKSVGNLRAQHGRVVAGRLNDIIMDDAAKSITITAEVVDDNEWTKVLKGCYTGFSVGGSYGKKWEDKELGKTRYTAKPVEASIVDLPCNPNASFTVVKSAGGEAQIKFDPALALLYKGLENFFQQPDATVLSFIEAELKKLAPVEKSKEVIKAERLLKLEKAKPYLNSIAALVGDRVLEKGLWTVSRLAGLLESAFDIQQCVAAETEYEGDNSTLPEELKNAVKALGEILCRMADEEVAELFGDEPVLENSMKPEELQKSVQDAFVKAIESEDFAKVLTKALDGGVLAKSLEPLLKPINDRLEKLEKAPTGGGPVVAVAKGDEVAIGKTGETKPEPIVVNGQENKAATLIKAAHAAGGQPFLR